MGKIVLTANCCFCKQPLSFNDCCSVGIKHRKRNCHAQCAMDYFKQQKEIKQ